MNDTTSPTLIHCVKLQKEAEKLPRQPYPGELGKKIYESISKPAWDMWLAHQTILINEYRLNMLDISARKMLEEEMIKFLFGEGSAVPEQFIKPKFGS